jgi:hypothetical protein
MFRALPWSRIYSPTLVWREVGFICKGECNTECQLLCNQVQLIGGTGSCFGIYRVVAVFNQN